MSWILPALPPNTTKESWHPEPHCVERHAQRTGERWGGYLRPDPEPATPAASSISATMLLSVENAGSRGICAPLPPSRCRSECLLQKTSTPLHNVDRERLGDRNHGFEGENAGDNVLVKSPPLEVTVEMFFCSDRCLLECYRNPRHLIIYGIAQIGVMHNLLKQVGVGGIYLFCWQPETNLKVVGKNPRTI